MGGYSGAEALGEGKIGRERARELRFTYLLLCIDMPIPRGFYEVNMSLFNVNTGS